MSLSSHVLHSCTASTRVTAVSSLVFITVLRRSMPPNTHTFDTRTHGWARTICDDERGSLATLSSEPKRAIRGCRRGVATVVVMEDVIDFIQSRPLIGYQMDGAHLNNVLVSLARQQQQLMDAQNRLNNRLGDIVDDVREIRDHQKQLESVIGELGGPAQLHHVRSRIADVERAVDGLARDMQDTKDVANAAGRDANQAGRLADDASRAASSLRDSVNALGGDMEKVAHQLESHRKSIGKALGDLEKDRQHLEQQVREAIREVQQRIERESGVERLRQMLDELSDRTDENFRSVEESARAVDAELSRQDTNQAALRAEISALDERARTALAALSSDADNKYHKLLDAFRQYEAGWTDLEEHMVRAGQLLASRKQLSPRSTSIRR